MKNISFEEYLDQKLPTWRTDLSEDIIIYLKNMYNEAIQWRESIRRIFDMTINHNSSDIDYSTDLEKANEKLLVINSKINSTIEQIKQVMIEDDTKEQNNNKTNQM